MVASTWHGTCVSWRRSTVDLGRIWPFLGPVIEPPHTQHAAADGKPPALIERVHHRRNIATTKLAAFAIAIATAIITAVLTIATISVIRVGVGARVFALVG